MNQITRASETMECVIIRFTLLLLSCSSSSLDWLSCFAAAGFRELSPTSQEKPEATCSLDGPAGLLATC